MEILGFGIDRLAATVFAKVPVFGTEIELIVLWLAIPMLFFTAWLGFPNIRGLGVAIRNLRETPSEAKAPGQVSQFAALTTAISGTVGLGNIAGVAVALSVGGPGAAFWMFVIGWFAMTLKCAEVTLGLRFREETPDGHIRGGPMYTLKNGFASKGWAKLGLALGGVYAAFALIGALPMLQVNQSYVAVAAAVDLTDTTGARWIYGAIMAFLVAFVVLGGITWLGRITSWLVPLMAIVYLCGVFAILILNAGAVPGAIALIVSDAFTGEAVAGGAIGAFVVGMRRAVFSSEAGIGSAVIAHAQARTRIPASEGAVALLEPFIDTVVICSLGALAMVVAGTYNQGLEGVQITQAAFAQVAGWFPAVLAIAVFLFGFSTLCAWGFYGLQSWGYLFGDSRFSQNVFKTLYVLLLPIGAVLDLGRVVDLIDSAFFLMAIPNIIVLYLFAPELRREFTAYMRSARARQTPE
ncbi:MAG TPA: amino acid carrier protein [Allosphingosinicella sp.]|nr:amino acid carrier protein [Allosphingosinicella sp.]